MTGKRHPSTESRRRMGLNHRLGRLAVVLAVGLAVVSNAGASDLDELVAGNNAFAYDLYQTLRSEEGSLFYSPLSISAALGMTYAGAAERTAQQMAETLHFTLDQDRLHPAFGELIGRLTTPGTPDPQIGGDPFVLDIANSLWGQSEYSFIPPFRQAFLDQVAECYDSPLRRLDFYADPEGSRQTINDWVSQQTRQRIKDLLKQGDITELTRLVLANAIYFNASWYRPFEEVYTRPQPFHLPDGDVTCQMMHQLQSFRYAEGPTYQAVELPYVGDTTSMLVLLPKPGQFEAFEESLSAETVDEIVSRLHGGEVALSLPQFGCEAEFELSDLLAEMGMPDAFDIWTADFSEMNGFRRPDDRGLYITKIRHKGWIGVDEAGTEAAAATAVVMGSTTSVPPPPAVFTADRAFVYIIRDRTTNSTLFIGRVCDEQALIPEPATLGMLLMGGLALLRRRG